MDTKKALQTCIEIKELLKKQRVEQEMSQKETSDPKMGKIETCSCGSNIEDCSYCPACGTEIPQKSPDCIYCPSCHTKHTIADAIGLNCCKCGMSLTKQFCGMGVQDFKKQVKLLEFRLELTDQRREKHLKKEEKYKKKYKKVTRTKTKYKHATILLGLILVWTLIPIGIKGYLNSDSHLDNVERDRLEREQQELEAQSTAWRDVDPVWIEGVVIEGLEWKSSDWCGGSFHYEYTINTVDTHIQIRYNSVPLTVANICAETGKPLPFITVGDVLSAKGIYNPDGVFIASQIIVKKVT